MYRGDGEQLRSRLAEGKVYLGERAEWAAQNFFRESNLTALREMALRLVAEHVDPRMAELQIAVRAGFTTLGGGEPA